MEELAPLKRLDPVNRQYLKDYTRHLHMKGVRPETIRTKLWRVYVFLDALGFPDAKRVQKKAIEDHIIARKKAVSPVTLEGEVLEFRLFIRWLVPKKEKPLFPVKMRRTKKILPVERLITTDEIRKLVESCTTQRDRALLMLLWDSAGRLSEVLNLKIGDVQFDDNGAVVILDGKTDRRRVRLISSVPDLQAWVNQHPLRNNPDSPLFVTHRRYGSECRPLDKRTVQNTLKNIGRRAGIQGVHPHILRHARLTDLVKQGFTEMELRLIAGWEKNSAMPEVYIHLSGRDIEEKILMKAGLLKPNEEPKKNGLDAVICPRCRHLNSYGDIYCARCTMALTDEAVRRQQRADQLVNKNLDVIIEWAEGRKKGLSPMPGPASEEEGLPPSTSP